MGPRARYAAVLTVHSLEFLLQIKYKHNYDAEHGFKVNQNLTFPLPLEASFEAVKRKSEHVLETWLT